MAPQVFRAAQTQRMDQAADAFSIAVNEACKTATSEKASPEQSAKAECQRHQPAGQKVVDQAAARYVQAHEITIARRPIRREQTRGGGCVGRQEGGDAHLLPAHIHAATATTLSETLTVHGVDYTALGSNKTTGEGCAWGMFLCYHL